jgi:hypothetical protein
MHIHTNIAEKGQVWYPREKARDDKQKNLRQNENEQWNENETYVNTKKRNY